MSAAEALPDVPTDAPFRPIRQPRLRCLSAAENGHRAREAAAYDAVTAKRPLVPPRMPHSVTDITAGASVLQQEIRRGIVAKDRNGKLWAAQPGEDE